MSLHRHASPTLPEGTVAGQVSAGDRPVAEATVMIIDGDVPFTDLAAMTDETGTFSLGGLAPGWYRIEARRGEAVTRQRVDVMAGESLWLDMVLPVH